MTTDPTPLSAEELRSMTFSCDATTQRLLATITAAQSRIAELSDAVRDRSAALMALKDAHRERDQLRSELDSVKAQVATKNDIIDRIADAFARIPVDGTRYPFASKVGAMRSELDALRAALESATRTGDECARIAIERLRQSEELTAVVERARKGLEQIRDNCIAHTWPYNTVVRLLSNLPATTGSTTEGPVKETCATPAPATRHATESPEVILTNDAPSTARIAVAGNARADVPTGSAGQSGEAKGGDVFSAAKRIVSCCYEKSVINSKLMHTIMAAIDLAKLDTPATTDASIFNPVTQSQEHTIIAALTPTGSAGQSGEVKGGDRLKMDYINSLPQPFVACFLGKDEWPVHDIDVQTGLLRIDVCGKLEVKHIADVKFFRDAEGVEHDSETFYSDYLPTTQPPLSAEPASAPQGGDDATPETDKWEYEQECNFDVPWEEHCRTLERQRNEARRTLAERDAEVTRLKEQRDATHKQFIRRSDEAEALAQEQAIKRD